MRDKYALVFVDVEAIGVSPFSGVMTEFGAVALNSSGDGIRDVFHGVLITADHDPSNPALQVINENTVYHDESKVMQDFSDWLSSIAERVVFVSDNNGYDFQWINYYFDKYGLANPFGHSSRRISDFYAGLTGDWKNTKAWKRYRVTVHDHNPVNDAVGNAEALLKLFELQEIGHF